jgi:hypothetical protein
MMTPYRPMDFQQAPFTDLVDPVQLCDAGVRRVNTLDFIASAEPARVEDTPDSVPARSVDSGFDGWLFPRSGVAFVWALKEEMTRPALTASTKVEPSPDQR